MKINTKILTASLFFGMLTFGQNIDSRVRSLVNELNNETLASNQATDSENSLSANITVKDTSKTKKRRDVPWYVERYRVSAGYYYGFNNANVEITGSSGTRSGSIDFEDDLGYDVNSSSFFADFQWRSTSRSRFMLSYYKVKRDSSYKLKKDIEFGDHVYHVDSEIYSYFDNDVFRFSYSYAILSKPKYEVGLSIGTHIIYMQLGVGLRGSTVVAEVSDDYKLTAPLPDLGIWGGYAITDRLAVNGGIDYLTFTVDNFDGDVVGYNISATYRIIKNLDLTAGFSSLDINVDSEEESFDGKIKWGNDGLSLKASYSFGKKNWD